MSKVKVAPESSAARAQFLRLSRKSQWGLLALVGGGSIWMEPELTTRPVYLAVLGLIAIVVPLVGWASRGFGAARRRLTLEKVSYVVLLAALIIIAGPAVRALMFALAVPAALSPLLVGRNEGRAVVAAAAIGVLVVSAFAWPTVGAPVLIEAATALTVVGFAYYLTGELVQIFAGARRHMLALSGRDGLTGAHTFSSFLPLALRIHAEAVAERRPYAVLIVDIEDLKSINARFGYDAGSRAIRLVATAIERLRAPSDLTARHDGDKLAILLPELEGRSVSELAQRIRNVVFATTLNVETQVVRIKANVGVAKYPIDGTTLDALLTKAEADMRTDRAGRGRPKDKPVFKRREGTKSG